MAPIEERLIMEVSKYRELFDTNNTDYKDTGRRVHVWKSISQSVQLPADECQKKWKNMRDAFVAWRRKIKRKKSGQVIKKFKDYRFAKEMEFLIPFTGNQKSSSSWPAMKVENDISDDEWCSDEDGDEDGFSETVETDNHNSDNENDHLDDYSMETLEPSPVSSSAGSHKRLSTATTPAPKRKKNDGGLESIVTLLREQHKEHDERRERRMHISQPIMDETESFFYSMGQTVKRLPHHLQAGVKLKICQIVMEAEIQSQETPACTKGSNSTLTKTFTTKSE